MASTIKRTEKEETVAMKGKRNNGMIQPEL
jgi:hypothetical protein